jgi:50S ribosomal protein L16 3-hydroxylase
MGSGAVDVSVLELVRRGFAHVEHPAVETQTLTSQRVIAVDDDLAIGNVGHGEYPSRAFVVVDGLLELHSHFDVVGKPIRGFDPNKFGVVFAERIVGLEQDRAGLSGRLAAERLLDSREDAMMSTVQVADRRARFLDQFAGRGIELVGKGDDGVGRNLHDAFPKRWSDRAAKSARHCNPVRRGCLARARACLSGYNRRMDAALLGGAPRRFLQRYWQQRPLLIRQAISGFRGLLSTRELFALAARDDVESRLVMRERGRWSLTHGPFRHADLRALPERNWTLLVQGVNLHLAAADALLRRFAFLPYSRLDDLLVSHAVPGGGVGPHVDSYDVFLLQGAGRRRWRIGTPRDAAPKPNLPLKILARFRPEAEWVLEPGDMLYLPPAIAHDGVAIDTCSTYSIGFRAPSAQEIATSFLDWLRDRIALAGQYGDAGRKPVRHPARIGRDLQAYATATLRRLAWDERAAAQFLGSHLTEPKAAVTFTAPTHVLRRESFIRRASRHGLRLDGRTQLLYDERSLFINGDVLAWPVRGRAALKRIADMRRLSPGETGDGAWPWFYLWYRNGFLHVG